MNAITFAFSLTAALAALAGPTAAQSPTTKPDDTIVVSAERGRVIVESWRAGNGWVFATTRQDDYGAVFVRYRVVIGVEGSLTVGGKTQVLLKMSPETDWMPTNHLNLPVFGGSARSLLKQVQAEIDRPRNSASPATAAALAGTLPKLVETIKPTIGRPGTVPERTMPN